MRGHLCTAIATIFAGLVTSIFAHAQEMPNMPGMQNEHGQHVQMNMPAVQAKYPRMGRAQEQAQSKLFTLEQAQQLASEANPTLRQAEAEIRAAKARQQQVGLYPNPTVGYTGDEIRGGSVSGGKQGFFVQQTIVTGGKLGNNRTVLSKETQIASIEAEEQKIRVETAIKMAYMRVLGAQELLDARRDLAKIEQDHAETQRELRNTGQADETEVLQSEIAARRQRLAAHMQENALLEEWRSLAAVIGKPDLPLAVVSGQLESGWPELNEEQITEKTGNRKSSRAHCQHRHGPGRSRHPARKTGCNPRHRIARWVGIQQQSFGNRTACNGLGRPRRSGRAIANLQS